MAVPHGTRFAIPFKEVFPQGAYLMGAVQPVPPETVGNLPVQPVVLEGLTVQPRAEASGQAKWITWVVRATGPGAVDTPARDRGSAKAAA